MRSENDFSSIFLSSEQDHLGHKQWVTCVAWAPDMSVVATGGMIASIHFILSLFKKVFFFLLVNIRI